MERKALRERLRLLSDNELELVQSKAAGILLAASEAKCLRMGGRDVRYE